MTETFLDATVRSVHGKSAVRKMRRAGRIPAVVYGLHDAISLDLDTRQASNLVQQTHGGDP